MKDTTLCLLVKEADGKISEVCLAMKKRGFGQGLWNGFGGKKTDEDASVEAAAIRETEEESSVQVKLLNKTGEIEFTFPTHPEWDNLMRVYLATEWVGEPRESEEMKPQWFKADNIPFDEMWPSDRKWMAEILAGHLVRGKVKHADVGKLLSQEIIIVDTI